MLRHRLHRTVEHQHACRVVQTPRKILGLLRMPSQSHPRRELATTLHDETGHPDHEFTIAGGLAFVRLQLPLAPHARVMRSGLK